MTPILTAARMKEADRKAIEEIGLPGPVLMENAARGCFEVIHELLEGNVAGRRMLVLCGGGNNGGDGLAIARHAAIHGMSVACVLLAPPDKLSPDAALQLNVLKAFIDVDLHYGAGSLAALHGNDFDMIVDAMLGTGAAGEPRPPVADAVEWANEINRPKIAIDIPTGLDADSGRAASITFRADVTITMAALKPGLLLGDGPDCSGEIFVAHIGAPDWLYDDSGCALLDAQAARDGVPEIDRTRHKYNRGKGLILAGSKKMPGAGNLAATAAIGAGAGLVVYGMPETAAPLAVPGMAPEIMAVSLPDADGSFAANAFDAIENDLEKYGVIALGPGITKSEQASAFARSVVRRSPLPVVLDADGLSAFAGHVEELPEHNAPLVITPHHGEMSRLLERSAEEIGADPIGAAREAAERFDCIAVLKGAPTVVALPSGEAWINAAGNPGMATAGSGDVLTGVIAGLIAGREPDDLAPGVLTAVWLHSRAGDYAAREKGLHTLRAPDMIRFLPEAFAELEEE